MLWTGRKQDWAINILNTYINYFFQFHLKPMFSMENSSSLGLQLHKLTSVPWWGNIAAQILVFPEVQWLWMTLYVQEPSWRAQHSKAVLLWQHSSQMGILIRSWQELLEAAGGLLRVRGHSYDLSPRSIYRGNYNLCQLNHLCKAVVGKAGKRLKTGCEVVPILPPF